MIIVTAKLPRRKLAFGVGLAALLCCSALVFNLGRSLTLPASADLYPDPSGIKSAEDRIEYVEEWGWEVLPEPVASEELLIPDVLDESYDEYLALQESQGFDISACSGKRVQRYAYEITNYPAGKTGIHANILIYHNTVIGGEVLDPKLNGFLHGLDMPE